MESGAQRWSRFAILSRPLALVFCRPNDCDGTPFCSYMFHPNKDKHPSYAAAFKDIPEIPIHNPGAPGDWGLDPR